MLQIIGPNRDNERGYDQWYVADDDGKKVGVWFHDSRTKAEDELRLLEAKSVRESLPRVKAYRRLQDRLDPIDSVLLTIEEPPFLGPVADVVGDHAAITLWAVASCGMSLLAGQGRATINRYLLRRRPKEAR